MVPLPAATWLVRYRTAGRVRASGRPAVTLALGALVDADLVARRVAERAVPRAVRLVHRLLQHLRAGRADLLERRVDVVGLEDQPGQRALVQQGLDGLPVLGRAAHARGLQHDAELGLRRGPHGQPAGAL